MLHFPISIHVVEGQYLVLEWSSDESDESDDIPSHSGEMERL
jgi:hypothetical protein